MVFIVTTYIGHLFMFSWELGVYHIPPDDIMFLPQNRQWMYDVDI